MKVFKFGGASINSIERIKNLGALMQEYRDEKLMVIISAMGKTTNALEKVAEAFFQGRQEDSLSLFEQIKNQHLTFAKYLLVTNYLSCEQQLKSFFTEVEWMLYDKPVREFDYYYDQVVCCGELLSTTIISSYFNEIGVANKWLDVRDIFRTDDDFRDADIDWSFTSQQVQQKVLPEFNHCNIMLTQGYIGATDENESTTLGREGSDYTAAVFANMLDAESQTIWKDVEAVMNADPKHFLDAQPIAELNYRETIEMAYYGAQVIHPKTIKPLQNKSIPLFVKSFLDPQLPGTIIHNQRIATLPPIYILKEKQVLLKVTTLDFSFVGDHEVVELYKIFESLHIKPNLTQIGAISFLCVLDDWAEKIEKLALKAAEFLQVEITRGLSILTIRHYTPAAIEKLTFDKKILLRQQTEETVQLLIEQ